MNSITFPIASLDGCTTYRGQMYFERCSLISLEFFFGLQPEVVVHHVIALLFSVYKLVFAKHVNLLVSLGT